MWLIFPPSDSMRLLFTREHHVHNLTVAPQNTWFCLAESIFPAKKPKNKKTNPQTYTKVCLHRQIPRMSRPRRWRAEWHACCCPCTVTVDLILGIAASKSYSNTFSRCWIMFSSPSILWWSTCAFLHKQRKWLLIILTVFSPDVFPVSCHCATDTSLLQNPPWHNTIIRSDCRCTTICRSTISSCHLLFEISSR